MWYDRNSQLVRNSHLLLGQIVIKDRQVGHYVMVSLWCESL